MSNHNTPKKAGNRDRVIKIQTAALEENEKQISELASVLEMASIDLEIMRDRFTAELNAHSETKRAYIQLQRTMARANTITAIAPFQQEEES